MKRNFLKFTAASVIAFGLLSTSFLVSVSAQDKSNLQGEGTRFEGTWNVRVTLRNCLTGDEIRSFDSVTTFMSGGTLMDSTSGIPQALKTPGQGVWSHKTGNKYGFSFKSFSFDPTGNYTGWTVIRQEAVLNLRGTAYESKGTSEVYTPNGILVFTGCSTTTAARFE